MAPHHHLKGNQTIKLIMAERDKALRERDLALSEKKAALAERDRAYLQRDAAITEWNSAILERDNAVAALKYTHENGMSDNCGLACPCSHHGNKNMYQQQQHIQNVHPSSQQLADVFPLRAVPLPAASQTGMKTKTVRKEIKVQPSPSKKLKTPRKSKRSGADTLRNAVAKTAAGDWRGAFGIGANLTKRTPMKKDHEWKSPDLGLNEIAFDESTMPAPVCSCTGKYHQCYRWGSGGWQSSCCTTTISMHPLPVISDKRHARIGGRKMSGTVFRKFLSRLSAEGHDLSLPVDLREHWAKHGTNGYITIR